MAAKSDTVKTDGDYNQWLEEELVPILVDAFGQDAEYWREVARGAKRYIDMLPVWEDFDSTVERIRLLLINRKILTQAENKDFGWIVRKRGLCIAIFVRHAINHGPYKLASLGEKPNLDRVRYKVKKPADEYIYVYAGHLAVDTRLRPGYVDPRPKDKCKPYWPNDYKEPQLFFPGRSKFYWPQDHVHAEPVVLKILPDDAAEVKSMQTSRKWSQSHLRNV